MGLFGNNQAAPAPVNEDKKEIERLQRRNSDMEHEHKLALQKKEAEHELALKEKEFELKHFKDEELQAAREELTKERQEKAVLQKENEMLVKITDLNSDVIDVKSLVKDLIKKLPEVNITSLSVQGGKD